MQFQKTNAVNNRLVKPIKTVFTSQPLIASGKYKYDFVISISKGELKFEYIRTWIKEAV